METDGDRGKRKRRGLEVGNGLQGVERVKQKMK